MVNISEVTFSGDFILKLLVFHMKWPKPKLSRRKGSMINSGMLSCVARLTKHPHCPGLLHSLQCGHFHAKPGAVPDKPGCVGHLLYYSLSSAIS